jgi:hypothetical protein
MYENFLRGRKKAVWVSISGDLCVDSKRDFTDIGMAGVELHNFKDTPAKQKIKAKEGVLFSTYSLLAQKASSGKAKSRLEKIIDWLGTDFEGPIVFDEAHKAKNDTNTGKAVIELQKRLPLARILYVSATGASEPDHMRYMTRLGLWGEETAFTDHKHFSKSMKKGCVVFLLAISRASFYSGPL